MFKPHWPVLVLAAIATACVPPVEPADPTPGVEPGVIGYAECDAEHPTATVGLTLCTPDSEAGYLLLSAFGSPMTYLLDPLGRIVHSWDSQWLPGMQVELLDDGSLMRATHHTPADPDWAAARGGGLEQIGWGGELVWERPPREPDVYSHHDIDIQADGTVVYVAYERHTREEALSMGRLPERLDDDVIWPDALRRIDPSTDEEVWRWAVWDHLVQDADPLLPNYGDPSSRPERIDINAADGQGPGGYSADWNHVNSVAYDAARHEYVITALSQNEVWIIDGDGGDLVWRWGNPEAHGGAGNPVLAGPHDAQRIPQGLPGAGNLLVFNNNGAADGGTVVQEVRPRMDDDGYARGSIGWQEPVEVWSYASPDFASRFAGGAQRLASGHTFITEAETGRMFEVTPEGEIVWEYISPIVMGGTVPQGEVPAPASNAVFRATRIAADHPALAGRDLSPGIPLVEPPTP